MQGGFLIRHSRLTALGIMLCVLAALFAVEAKIAWFSPAGSATAQISFDKARPAEPPKAYPHGMTSTTPPAHDLAATATFVAASILLAAIAAVMLLPARPRTQLALSPGFSASLLFRPPPVL